MKELTQQHKINAILIWSFWWSSATVAIIVINIALGLPTIACAITGFIAGVCGSTYGIRRVRIYKEQVIAGEI